MTDDPHNLSGNSKNQGERKIKNGSDNIINTIQKEKPCSTPKENQKQPKSQQPVPIKLHKQHLQQQINPYNQGKYGLITNHVYMRKFR